MFYLIDTFNKRVLSAHRSNRRAASDYADTLNDY